MSSNAVWMRVSKSLAGLLTLDFPNLVYHADYAGGNVRNQDGTQNSANNPAAAGSTIALFATGLGATDPAVAPGSVVKCRCPLPLRVSAWAMGSSVLRWGCCLKQGQLPVPISNIVGIYVR
jgi:uncharacterized protein (TIGR03437 family)